MESLTEIGTLSWIGKTTISDKSPKENDNHPRINSTSRSLGGKLLLGLTGSVMLLC